MNTYYKGIFILTLLFLLAQSEATKANPNFSRKYKIGCATCHTVPPQLTRTGIEFRRLGYRFPNELNEETIEPEKTYQQKEFPQQTTALNTMETAGCMNCHAVGSKGEGLNLEGIGTKMNSEKIKVYVVSANHPGSDAASELSADDLQLVADFLASLTQTTTQKDKWSYDFSNFISVRGRARYVYDKVENVNATNQFRFNDMTLFYLGPVNNNLTVFFETEYDQGFEPNVLAQGSLIFGNANEYFFLKVGHMRFVRQGVSLLDRPKTISTDLVVTGRSHLYALSTDQVGIETSYGFNQRRTLIRGFITNGLDSLGSGRPVGKQDLNTQKDFGIMIENLFGEKTATSVSAVFYHGATPTSSGNISFERYGLFGTYAINDNANDEDIRINAGALAGYDDVPNAEKDDFNFGFTAGIDKRLGDQFYASVRYDQFRPTDRISSNITKAYTLGIIKQMFTYLRLSAEYQLFQRPGNISESLAVLEFYMFF